MFFRRDCWFGPKWKHLEVPYVRPFITGSCPLEQVFSGKFCCCTMVRCTGVKQPSYICDCKYIIHFLDILECNYVFSKLLGKLFFAFEPFGHRNMAGWDDWSPVPDLDSTFQGIRGFCKTDQADNLISSIFPGFKNPLSIYFIHGLFHVFTLEGASEKTQKNWCLTWPPIGRQRAGSFEVSLRIYFSSPGAQRGTRPLRCQEKDHAAAWTTSRQQTLVPRRAPRKAGSWVEKGGLRDQNMYHTWMISDLIRPQLL